MDLEPIPGTYARAVVIANPGCSNAGSYDTQITNLHLPLVRPEIPDYDPAMPLHDRVRRMWDSMYKLFEPGDVVVVRGGDGMLHHVVNGLMQDEGIERGFNTLPVMTVPEGYANDVDVQLNNGDPLNTVLREGRAFDLHPIDVRMAAPDGTNSLERAVGYFSLGGSALAAGRLDAMKHSDNPLERSTLTRFPLEVLTTMREVAAAPDLVFWENGEYAMLSDRLFVRGSRIAKQGRTHTRLDLPLIEDIKSRPDGHGQALQAMVRLAAGMLPGEMITQAEFVVRTHKKAHEGRKIHAQWDGELGTIDSGTWLSVSVSELTYRALSTQLGRPQRQRKNDHRLPWHPVPVSGQIA